METLNVKCRSYDMRTEIALTRLQLAELLLEHYPDEKADALEHLDFAINEFREMRMRPSLERALRRREIPGRESPCVGLGQSPTCTGGQDSTGPQRDIC